MKVIHVLRKPLSEGTVAKNVLKHGTGGINIDASRISTSDNLNGGAYAEKASDRPDGAQSWRYKRGDKGNAGEFVQPEGRWPANVILQHLPDCRYLGIVRVRSSSGFVADHHTRNVPLGEHGIYGSGDLRSQKPTCYVNEDGTETVASWACVSGCPVAALDEQSGVTQSCRSTVEHDSYGQGTTGFLAGNSSPWNQYDDAGGASRFFKQVGGSDGGDS